MLVIYGLKNCDACRKALKSLPGAKLVDVRETALPEDVMARAHQAFGAALTNTRSKTWRNLSAPDRQIAPERLIVLHPTLMKRPMIVVDNQLFLGWNETVARNVKAAL